MASGQINELQNSKRELVHLILKWFLKDPTDFELFYLLPSFISSCAFLSLRFAQKLLYVPRSCSLFLPEEQEFYWEYDCSEWRWHFPGSLAAKCGQTGFYPVSCEYWCWGSPWDLPEEITGVHLCPSSLSLPFGCLECKRHHAGFRGGSPCP